ncbi:MAG: TolC family protein [Duncaniella sp.]|nr:TolC family protein [Duncaniella sp.]
MLRKLSILLLCFSPSISFASDFDDVLSTIVSNNLSLKNAVAVDEASIAEMKAENTLEAPEFSYENLFGAKGIGDKRNFSLSQSFDWPGVYAARSQAVKKSESAMQYLRESGVLDLRRDVRVVLIDMINIRQQIATTSKICDGLAVMSEYYKKASEEGNETRLDYNKAVVEHINAVRELKTLKADSSVIAATLRDLNGGKEVKELIARVGLNYPHADLSSLIPERESIRMKDPSVAASRASIEAQKALVKVEKRSLLPGFSVAYLHEWEMGDNFNGFSVSVTLPFLTARSKVKAASMRLASQNLDEEMAVIKIYSEMQADYETAVELRELLREYRGVMSDDSTFELLRKALDVGQINFLTYMQELNYFLAARRDFLEAHYRYHLAVARLQRYE